MIVVICIAWSVAGQLIKLDNKNKAEASKDDKIVLADQNKNEDNSKDEGNTKEDEEATDKDGSDEEGQGAEENTNIGETIKVSSIGNLIIHSPQLPPAYNGSGYDFSPSFEYIKEKVEGADVAMAVLETSLKGDGNYAGHPLFNTPDEIIDALKGIGVNHINFGTNHILDGGTDGIIRSKRVTEDKGLEVSGIRSSVDEDKYVIEEVKGEKIGVISYVYETALIDGVHYLNGIPMSEEQLGLINSFNYEELNLFYTDLEKNMNEMKEKGAEFIIVNLHFGEEYESTPRNYQKEIAAKLNEMGVDILLGNHPHVIQPYEVLTNSQGKKTFVTYGQGNNLSNQCLTTLGDARTEDGFIVNFTLKVEAEGLKIQDYTIIPVWMYREPRGDGYFTHRIIPLDGEGNTDIPIPVTTGESSAAASLQRTKNVLGENSIGTFQF